jgi:hypothetical protein
LWMMPSASPSLPLLLLLLPWDLFICIVFSRQ